MNPFSTIESKLVSIPVDDIDTDQIIPARFLKTTDKLGLGASLFADWRYLENGSENSDFILNQPAMAGRTILVAGDNFGCGSSREHAPWALVSWGFRVIISTSFADIFRNNALKNGLLLVQVNQEVQSRLRNAAASDVDGSIDVNLESQTLTIPGHDPIHFPIDAFSKRCLLEGMDQLAYLLSFREAISQFEDETSET